MRRPEGGNAGNEDEINIVPGTEKIGRICTNKQCLDPHLHLRMRSTAAHGVSEDVERTVRTCLRFIGDGDQLEAPVRA